MTIKRKRAASRPLRSSASPLRRNTGDRTRCPTTSAHGQPTRGEEAAAVITVTARSGRAGMRRIEKMRTKSVRALGAAVLAPNPRGAGRDGTQSEDGAVAPGRTHPTGGLRHEGRRPWVDGGPTGGPAAVRTPARSACSSNRPSGGWGARTG
jgi:hypothetical protein